MAIKPSADEPKMTVLFDGSCPLCRREIAFYRRRTGADAVSWVDVSGEDGTALPAGLSRRQAMARFHVVAADGAIVSGARAFVALWSAVPGFRALAWIGRRPPAAWLLEAAYRVFLPVRPWLQGLFRER